MSNVNNSLALSSPQLYAPNNTTSNTTSSATSSSDSTTGSSNANLTSGAFITLLVAQLQGQNPLNPMDPTQFVTQLVQFNQLDQLMQINQELGTKAAGSNAGSPSVSTIRS